MPQFFLTHILFNWLSLNSSHWNGINLNKSIKNILTFSTIQAYRHPILHHLNYSSIHFLFLWWVWRPHHLLLFWWVCRPHHPSSSDEFAVLIAHTFNIVYWSSLKFFKVFFPVHFSRVRKSCTKLEEKDNNEGSNIVNSQFVTEEENEVTIKWGRRKAIVIQSLFSVTLRSRYECSLPNDEFPQIVKELCSMESWNCLRILENMFSLNKRPISKIHVHYSN